MKKRSLAGHVGIGIFIITLVCVVVAFCAPSWLVSDYRITGAKLDRLGLWSHCFRSLPDPQDEYQRRFFVGCRWVYDPFTTGYDEIRGFLIPHWFIDRWYRNETSNHTCAREHLGKQRRYSMPTPAFMLVTQFFFTLCFLCVLISVILVLLFFLCCGPDQKHFILLVRVISGLLFGAGFTGGIAVIVFACLGNTRGWMPEQTNNYLGWAFGLAVVGVVMAFISGILFLVESTVQHKKREYLKESQIRFELEQETKA
ncbi:unnamed protein product [Timema podura]|uniref:Uncharacterized protein n=1 Tax=Timema podura TaxID=61482 RepID=A0ABN7NH79_TIMPD|nr:unnamed protein product [Timema podura]